MKKSLAVVLAVAVLACFWAVPAFSADKLIVKDSNSVTKFVVTDSGSTAIGTDVPESTLTVVGPTFPAAKIRREVSFTTNGRGVAAYELKSTGDMADGFGPSFEFWISDNTYTASMAVASMEAVREGADNSGKWILRTANNGTLGARLAVNTLGYLGVGVTSPTHPLQMASGAYVTAGGVWTNASSREFKDNIQGLNSFDALKTLEGLTPVTFTYKADASDHHVGFIAEDVPDLVATKDRKGLSSMDIVAVLTKVVQEQQKTIQQLTERINDLEGRVSKTDRRDGLSIAKVMEQGMLSR